MAVPIMTVEVRYEQDVVLARQRTRQIAGALGFDAQDQTKLATAVSELARNAYGYAGGGKVEFSIEGASAPQIFLMCVKDTGPGIVNLKEILAGSYHSQTGMGLGITGARRLVDQCEIRSLPQKGTNILLKKLLPRRLPFVTPKHIGELIDKLAVQRSESPIDEVKRQNQELLRALAEARERQEELARLNQELEDTNRGVVALYAELDERANHLRRADEMKTSFLSNMSHEFRTPLNSILALSQILLERTDGELAGEQEIQVGFIRKGAESLLQLVNNLLDLAKIEAGKIELQPIEFAVSSLFSALRGMLRPLLVGESVRLVFDDPRDLPMLFHDESKISQVLRNFIANALKFTERGEVRVAARWNESDKTVSFSVSDTGIGIAAQDMERIFEEFTQLDSPVQRRVKGTGLGLPLCRKLAALMDGTIEVASELGSGSTFCLTVPATHVYRDMEAAEETLPEKGLQIEEGRCPILILEDEPQTRLIYESYLRGSVFQMVPAANIRQAREVMRQIQPRAIVMDIVLRGEESWNFLAELKSGSAMQDVPILVVSAVEDEAKGFALGADEYCLKPLQRINLLKTLERLTGEHARDDEVAGELNGLKKRLLIIDDQAAARYILVKMIDDGSWIVRQAKNGSDGLRMAKEILPNLILLDLDMPDISGFSVLDQLKADDITRAIPVAIVTSLALSEQDRAHLEASASYILNKSELSRQRIAGVLSTSLSKPVASTAAHQSGDR